MIVEASSFGVLVHHTPVETSKKCVWVFCLCPRPETKIPMPFIVHTVDMKNGMGHFRGQKTHMYAFQFDVD